MLLDSELCYILNKCDFKMKMNICAYRFTCLSTRITRLTARWFFMCSHSTVLPRSFSEMLALGTNSHQFIAYLWSLKRNVAFIHVYCNTTNSWLRDTMTTLRVCRFTKRVRKATRLPVRNPRIWLLSCYTPQALCCAKSQTTRNGSKWVDRLPHHSILIDHKVAWVKHCQVSYLPGRRWSTINRGSDRGPSIALRRDWHLRLTRVTRLCNFW